MGIDFLLWGRGYLWQNALDEGQNITKNKVKLPKKIKHQKLIETLKMSPTDWLKQNTDIEGYTCQKQCFVVSFR